MDIFQLCNGLLQTMIMAWALRIAVKSHSVPATTEGVINATGKSLVGPLIAMAVLAGSAWIPYILHIGQPERVMAMTAWGGMQDGCYVVMDGSKLQHFTDKYNIFLACGISDPTIDQNQDTAIAISSGFTVGNGPIPIATKYPSALLDRIKSLSPPDKPQPFNLWHNAFLFPKKGDIGRVKKLSDVREFGGKLISNCEPIE